MKKIRLSVRNLVEFVLRSGDIDNRFVSASRAQIGTRIHQKIQREQRDYKPEVTLCHSFEYKDFLYVIEGRADGIGSKEGLFYIDEIKSTAKPLEEIPEEYNTLHWAQAKVYGYIYGLQNKLTEIGIQLTYCNIDNGEIKRLFITEKISDLERFVYHLLELYLCWAEWENDWTSIRNKTIKKLQFPFKEYRRGQREMAVAVYRSIENGTNLFVQAPTGTGKTISAFFPAVKALAENNAEKIFYLTAKTITRQVAEEALNIMRKEDLRLKSVTITAKEKICLNEKCECNPEACLYAKGHYDRVNRAILDILKNEDHIGRNIIEKYSKEYNICPFEFCLDLSLFADSIICDYNYAFDPRVNLKRFFEETNCQNVLLIDEGHNLVDRAREMFSAQISKRPVMELKKALKHNDRKIYKCLEKINKVFIEFSKNTCRGAVSKLEEPPSELLGILRQFQNYGEKWLLENKLNEFYDEFLQLYFDIGNFIKIWELYDEDYTTFIENNGVDVNLKIYCLDPSRLLADTLNKVRSAILFSATFTPLEYFRDILGGNAEDGLMSLPSPFDSDNLCLLIDNKTSTRYKDRNDRCFSVIAERIYSLTKSKVGNYLAFFPSYRFMYDVLDIFKTKYPDLEVKVQTTSLTEAEKEEFLNAFSACPERSMIAFAVMGGIFSEGIDLTGERLSGAVIAGVGLPQVCAERDAIMEYFQSKCQKGFEFAYMYPGMNKVAQAAGRVIRTESDRGAVILIDKRFTDQEYFEIMPGHWKNNLKLIKNALSLENMLNNFWKGNNLNENC